MVRYLLEDTPLIPCLINNKPKLSIHTDMKSVDAVENEETKEEIKNKSPEQSKKPIDIAPEENL